MKTRDSDFELAALTRSGAKSGLSFFTNLYQEVPIAALAAAALKSASGHSSIGYFCIADTMPIVKLGSVSGLGKRVINKMPFWDIDSLSHYDYDGDTAGPIKKIGHSMIREQLGFYNALANPYIGDPLGGSLINILDVFKSRLRLIKDNRLDLLKIYGETFRWMIL